MNEHLVERFKRNRFQSQQHYEADSTKQARSSLGQDIQRYVNRNLPSQQSLSWCRMPEIPTTEEILTPVHPLYSRDDTNEPDQHNAQSEDNLSEDHKDFHLYTSEFNNLDGPWASREDYLRTHYKLLRADALISLRQAVAYLRRAPTANESTDFPSWSFYDSVFFTGVTPTTRGVGIRVRFSLNRVGKRIDWKQSQRLMAGSLVVLLSAPDARECKVATVAARPLANLEKQTGPEIDLFFARVEDYDIDCQREWIMVEDRSAYFESERHTMVALQRMMDESFPLSDHLVNVEQSVPPASHLADQWIISDNVQQLLDSSQLAAIERILNKKLALIQGPPGTGKTFVSVQALKMMLRQHKDGDPPIVIACQTNQALDQLLRQIEGFTEYVRLGSRSKDEEIKKRTMFETRRAETGQFPRSSLMRNAYKRLDNTAKEMIDLLQPLRVEASFLDPVLLERLLIISKKQHESLVKNAQGWITAGTTDHDRNVFETWLGTQAVRVQQQGFNNDRFYSFEEIQDVEELRALEAEQMVTEDDDGMLDERFHIDLADTWDGKGTHRDELLARLLETKDDIGRIPPKVRGPLYHYLLQRLKAVLLVKFKELVASHLQMVKDRQLGRWEEDCSILSKRKVVGLTTTGLSKYRALIASLRPRIILIEEAAETLEAPIIAACVESLEQLILVGDHKQLRPQCHFKQLESSNLHVSLFERLINNNVEFTMLNRQRRMIPAVRGLLKPIYGDKIDDHPDVLDAHNRPPVPGMGNQSVYFLNHDWIEKHDDQMSYANDLEAEMIVQFVRYLILNGTSPEKITVLTFYNGQRRKLLSSARREIPVHSPSLKIVTVDSYQGEENDVVILSLVRNNHAGSIGFLAVDNRVCVALSRARRGLYIFGNAKLLQNGSNTWDEVVKILNEAGSNGRMLPLRCQAHNNPIQVELPEEFKNIDGGCDRPCQTRLICGHRCPKKCHAMSHDQYRCTVVCAKVLPCNHKCAKACAEPCRCSKCGDENSNSNLSASNTTSRFSQAFSGSSSPAIGGPPSLSSRSIGRNQEMVASNLPSGGVGLRDFNAVKHPKYAVDPKTAVGKPSPPCRQQGWRDFAHENAIEITQDSFRAKNGNLKSSRTVNQSYHGRSAGWPHRSRSQHEGQHAPQKNKFQDGGNVAHKTRQDRDAKLFDDNANRLFDNIQTEDMAPRPLVGIQPMAGPNGQTVWKSLYQSDTTEDESTQSSLLD